MESELKNLRGYRFKTFGSGGRISTQHIYPGDVHYFNKLGLGDGIVGFRGIDNTLSFVDDGTRRGWTFLFHNYQPFAPEYADDWAGYRDLYQGKDQIVGFRPRNASHVLGRLVPNIPGLTNQNAIIYDDALGSGIDYIIAFTFKKMLKIVRIRDGFKPVVDTDFDFEMKYPNALNIYEKDPTTGDMTQIDPATPRALTARSQLYIGIDQADGKDWFTRIIAPRVWDSGVKTSASTGQRVEIAPAAIATGVSKTFLRKRVTAAFLAASVGDVYTDASFSYSENKDTYYGTSFSTGGAPNAATLAIGGWGDTYYSFVEWDLTGTLTDDQVWKAYIRFTVAGFATNDSGSILQVVTSAWTEAGVTSASNPSSTTTGQVNFPNMATLKSQHGGNAVGSPPIYIDWTQNYKNWKSGATANNGVKINGTTGPSDAQHNLISSDDTDSNKFPVLIVSTAPEILSTQIPILGSAIRPRAFAPGLAR